MKLVSHSFLSSVFFLLKAWSRTSKVINARLFSDVYVMCEQAEGGAHQGDGSIVLGTAVSEHDAMLLHVSKVLLGLFAGACTQT